MGQNPQCRLHEGQKMSDLLQAAAALIKNHDNLVGVPIHLPDVAWRCGHQSEIKIYRCTECCKEKVPAKRIGMVMLLRLQC
jgi:hypothetical protein